MSTNSPPQIIKYITSSKLPSKKIVLQPSKHITHIPPKYVGAPLIHMYREGGYRPSIRWRISNPKPVGWLARRWEPWKEEKQREKEGKVKISLEWTDDRRPRELVRRAEIEGDAAGEGSVTIRKYTSKDSKLIEDTDKGGAGGDGALRSRPIEYAPVPAPVPAPIEPSPEAAGPHIRKVLASNMPFPMYTPRPVPEAKFIRRVLFDADAQGEVDERKVKISKNLNGDPTGSEPEEPGPRIRKVPTHSPEPKEPALSSQHVLKANLRPILTELPEGLSWDTVLALVLPEKHILRPRIDMLRRAYDRHYYQGAIPHLKLIYPFLSHPLDGPLSTRLHTAISQHAPFPIHLTTLQRLGRAPRSTTSTTGKPLPLLTLLPSPTSLPNLNSLQYSLRTTFSQEIDKVVAAGGDMSTGVLHPNSPPSLIPGEWVGYVTLGSIKSRRKDMEEVKERFRRGLWGREGVRAENGWEAERFGYMWGEEVKKVRECEDILEGEGEEFKWVVDRVSVLRREKNGDGEGGLEVVGEIMLGGKVDGYEAHLRGGRSIARWWK
ncbi:hypothetical protein EV426DRAFT_645124 [Tirmania nivea]|nr:hypothetical protein EV426DRAFT_645124 [Tirmania nivea]